MMLSGCCKTKLHDISLKCTCAAHGTHRAAIRPGSGSGSDLDAQCDVRHGCAVQEQGGFVWLFYGSLKMPAAERPPIPCIPELSDPTWRAVYGGWVGSLAWLV